MGSAGGLDASCHIGRRDRRPAGGRSHPAALFCTALAVLVLSGLGFFASASAARTVTPLASIAITGFTADPATVSSGGATVVAASVSGASTCELSANKAIAGLPVTFSCEGGSVEREVTMPANAGTKFVKYQLSLTADGTHGKATAKTTVTVTPPTLGGALQLGAGLDQTCAALSSGHVDCWGGNEYGVLGDGTAAGPEACKKKTPCATRPVEALGVTDAVQVSGGFFDSCALLSTGHVDCWGDWVALGDGSKEGSDTPVEVLDLTEAVQISVGGESACALLSGGHVDCWGDGLNGEIGNGTSKGSSTPVEVLGIDDAIQVAAGSDDACALLSTGHIDCWGDNRHGQLGIGTSSGPETCRSSRACSTTPVEVQGIESAAQVALGDEWACAVLSSGHADCWGENSVGGTLGDGTHESSDTPVEVLGVTDAVQAVASFDHTCALLSTGRVDCWGSNTWGELGNGTATGSDTPVEVVGIADASQLAASWTATCALLPDGHVDCWGDGHAGQLGNGSTKSSDTPVAVAE